VISACLNGVQAVAALRLFETMRSQELTPNVIAYNAVIGVGAKGVQAVAALQLFEPMTSQELTPNVIAYDLVISAYTNGVQSITALSPKTSYTVSTPATDVTKNDLHSFNASNFTVSDVAQRTFSYMLHGCLNGFLVDNNKLSAFYNDFTISTNNLAPPSAGKKNATAIQHDVFPLPCVSPSEGLPMLSLSRRCSISSLRRFPLIFTLIVRGMEDSCWSIL
jgi:hypothetical protein